MQIHLKKREWIKRSLLAGLGIAVTSSLYIYDELYDIEVKELELFFHNLDKEFDGYTVVQISDLHLSIYTQDSYLLKIIEILNQLNGDLLAITGDFVTSNHDLSKMKNLKKYFDQLKPNYIKYAVLGNHDYLSNPNPLEEKIKEMGIKLLKNQNDQIKKGNKYFNIIGVEDIWRSEADLDRASKDIDPEKFSLLLCHNPSYIKDARNYQIDLMLSGHTHGGQVQLPFIGPLIVPTERKYAEGLITEKHSYLYVNRGLGVITPPVRFLCRPEITVFKLRVS